MDRIGRVLTLVTAAVVLVAAPGCMNGGVAPMPGGSAGSDPFTATPVCTSASTWSNGNLGSDLMNPGLACIGCHTSLGDGPRLSIAGTVYPTAHEPDLCNGVGPTSYPGVTVTIIDANQQAVELIPNAAGNFLYQGLVAFPITARVTYGGRERTMTDAQTSGDCNSCHTDTGANNAPGRILLP